MLSAHNNVPAIVTRLETLPQQIIKEVSLPSVGEQYQRWEFPEKAMDMELSRPAM